MGDGVRPHGIFGSLIRLGRIAFAAVADGLFSRTCLACGALLPARSLPALDLCPGCSVSCLPAGGPRCPVCGIPVERESAEPCAACRGEPPAFDSCRTAFLYAGPIPGILLKLKYGEAFELARPLGRILAATVLASSLGDADVLVPVPVSAKRLRSRGYNQSALLVSSAASCLGIPWLPAALRRVRDPGPQIGRNRRERQASVAGCFQVEGQTRLTGLHVILMDDVVTTGATASECSRVLKATGAARVDVFAVARAVSGL